MNATLNFAMEEAAEDRRQRAYALMDQHQELNPDLCLNKNQRHPSVIIKSEFRERRERLGLRFVSEPLRFRD
jgi:hypothetical protein